MAEELFAAEQSIIGALNPAFAQRFEGKTIRVLEDRRPHPKPRWQRRLTRAILIDRAKCLPHTFTSGALDVDDLIEP